MSLEHAILGFRNYSPHSGYDLKKMFDVSVRHFWPADQSQIYRTLARITEEGWAQMEKIEQEDRPDRKVYHITEAGRAELMRWLESEVAMPEDRIAPLVQVFFAAKLTHEQVLTIFERAEEQVLACLARLNEAPAQMKPLTEAVPSPREQFFWQLTLELGIRIVRARLAWTKSVIRRIKNGDVPRE